MALLRSVATVGSFTLVSRVLGFIRDILTAAILGAGPVADAFFVAQRLPNLFRALFAEGAFSAAFVPLGLRGADRGGEAIAARICRGSVRRAVRRAARLCLVGRDVHAGGDAGDRPRLRRRSGEIRSRGHAGAHHLSLSHVDLADGAARRTVEHPRPVCRPGGDADPVEPVADCGAHFDGPVGLG